MLEEVELQEFIRYIFPKGSLQKTNISNENKGNVIIMCTSNVLNKTKDGYYKKPFIIFDGLENLNYFKNAEFAYISPVTYFGKSPKKSNLKNIHALTFDLDGVTPKHLKTLFDLIEQSFLLKPTFITNSGNGIHLYYVFKKAIKATSKNYKTLTTIKSQLTTIIWNGLTSSLVDVQSQGILQGFRIPSSATKFGAGYLAKTYQYGEKIEIKNIYEFLNVHNVMYRPECKFKTFDKSDFGNDSENLEKWKAKDPKWYDEKVIQKLPNKHFTNNPKMYYW